MQLEVPRKSKAEIQKGKVGVMELKPLIIGEFIAKIPVIQGGMGVGVSLSSLAAAVAREGGIGIISSAQIGFREPDYDQRPFEANFRALNEEIKKARELAPTGILGVNIMVASQRYEEYVKVAVESGIDVIISGAGLPMDLPRYVEGSKTKIAPIVSSVKSAEVICKYWLRKYNRLPDFVVIEGPLAGGHLGFSPKQLEEYTVESYDEEIKLIMERVQSYSEILQVTIPVIVAGGVYTKEDMVKYLNMGAAGVQMGTRFVTTFECDAPLDYKEAYINATKESIKIMKSPVGMPGRAIENSFMIRSHEGRIPHDKCHLCVVSCNPKETPYCITDALVNAVTHRMEDALLFCGANAFRATKLESVHDIMQEFASI